MDEKEKELERIQKALMDGESTPAFDDPEEIREPRHRGYQNFANNYGNDPKEETEEDRKALNEKVILGLMITASVLCLGIIGVLGYWLGVLL